MHIYIDIVNIIERGRVGYLTTYVRLTLYTLLKLFPQQFVLSAW